MLVGVTLVLILPISTVSSAGTFTFPVQSEQAITGTTTGLAGAQTDDGVREGLHESDTASDPITTPSTQTLTTGTIVGGAFPAGITSEDATFVQYREALPPSSNYYPSTQTITTGSACGGTFPTSLQSSNDAYLCLREGTIEEALIGYRSNTGTNTVNSPKTRPWDGAAWGGETERATAGSPIRAVRMAWSPIAADTRIIVTLSDDGWLDAYVCTPTCTVTNNIGQVWSTAPTTAEARFDIAYEYTSGEALLVYGVLSTDTTRDIAYKTYIGGSWNAEQYLDDTGHATDVQYSLIRLASKTGSNQIGLVGGDDTNDDVNAWIWDGTAWGSFTEITATATSPNREEAAIAWETNSGNLLAVAALASDMVSKEYTSSWSSAVTSPFAENPLNRLSLKPNPAGDDMIILMGDEGDGLESTYWTGSAWANNVVQDADPDGGGRAFDFAWEPTGSNGLLVYGDNAGQISYKTFTAPNTWGSQTNVAMGANAHPWVQLRTNPRSGSVKILGAVMETTALDLGAIRWDGTTFTVIGASTFSADVGITSYESFELEYGEASGNQLLVQHDWSAIPTGADAYDLCVEAHITNAAGESALVRVLTPPGTWNTRTTVSKTADDNADQCYTLTTTEFNAGAPSIQWIGSTETGDATQSDVNIDHERIIRRFTNYRLDVTYEWTGVPAGVSYVLSVKGYRSDENVDVQVLTPPATWNTRLTVNSLTNTMFTYTLTASEYNGGSPQVRFLDVAGADPSASDLFLDWVAITTIRLTYSLEVRQNITGVITGSNPILVVKGNISAGGENFHVHVWNFTSSAWALLLSAPFTATNAYHNSSLAADHLSGGTVRVRFVDGASQDSTPWALSLDFVAVAITNEQAVLTNAGVSPASGYITTSFTFFVRYSDSENNAPAFVNLTLDGTSYAMVENNSADTNYVDGKDYFLNRVIGIRGTFNYSFSARASAGDLTLATTPVRQLSVLNRAPSISTPSLPTRSTPVGRTCGTSMARIRTATHWRGRPRPTPPGLRSARSTERCGAPLPLRSGCFTSMLERSTASAARPRTTTPSRSATSHH